jgi:guanine deaminase
MRCSNAKHHAQVHLCLIVTFHLLYQVCMDKNGAVDYEETTEESLRGCREFVDSVLSLDDPLVQPAVTPRFIPTCSSDLMTGLAAIAEAHNLLIQSHISESNDEVRCGKEGE